jgi:hypothetical protein
VYAMVLGLSLFACFGSLVLCLLEALLLYLPESLLLYLLESLLLCLPYQSNSTAHDALHCCYML